MNAIKATKEEFIAAAEKRAGRTKGRTANC